MFSHGSGAPVILRVRADAKETAVIFENEFRFFGFCELQICGRSVRDLWEVSGRSVKGL